MGSTGQEGGEGEGPRMWQGRPDGLLGLEYTQEDRKVHLRRALVPLPHGRGLSNGQLSPLPHPHTPGRWTYR